MAGPWEKYTNPPSAGPWQKYSTEPQNVQAYSGGILPLSKDAQGNVRWDWDAGIPGALKRAVTLPGDVAAGEVDPFSDEAIGRAADLGLFFTPMNPGVRAGERAIPGEGRARMRKTAPPSIDDLKAAAGAGFQKARKANILYDAASVASGASALRASLERDGVLAELAPKTFALIAKLENPPEGSAATVAGLLAARRSFQHAAGDFNNPTEQLAAQRGIRSIDQFLSRPPPEGVVAGATAAAKNVGRTVREANQNYAAAKRSERITGIEDAATIRAGAANSGKNLGNSIRQRTASVVLTPKGRRGFTPKEVGELSNVATGTWGRNRARDLGNLLGGGGGLGAAVTGGMGGLAGAHYGGLAGALIGGGLPLAGWAAKAGENRATAAALRKVDEATRRRSPLFRNVPSDPRSPEYRAMLVRLLLQTRPMPESDQGQ